MTLGYSARRPRGEWVAMCFRDVPAGPATRGGGRFPRAGAKVFGTGQRVQNTAVDQIPA